MRAIKFSGAAACVAGVVVSMTGHGVIGGLFFIIGASLVIGGLAIEGTEAHIKQQNK